MRLTDDRYAGERSQFELALRMIRPRGPNPHDSRMHRPVRRPDSQALRTYFRNADATARCAAAASRRARCSSSSRTPDPSAAGDDARRAVLRGPPAAHRRGRQACTRAGRAPTSSSAIVSAAPTRPTCVLHDDARLSFEWAWNLLNCIAWNDELYLAAAAATAMRAMSRTPMHSTPNICPACELPWAASSAGTRLEHQLAHALPLPCQKNKNAIGSYCAPCRTTT